MDCEWKRPYDSTAIPKHHRWCSNRESPHWLYPCYAEQACSAPDKKPLKSTEVLDNILDSFDEAEAALKGGATMKEMDTKQPDWRPAFEQSIAFWSSVPLERRFQSTTAHRCAFCRIFEERCRVGQSVSNRPECESICPVERICTIRECLTAGEIADKLKARYAELYPGHGYRVRDIVAARGIVFTIRCFNPSSITVLEDAQGTYRHGCRIETLGPLHRCPDYGWKNRADGVPDKPTVYWIANPPGAPQEPFVVVDEKPYPPGTWVNVPACQEILRITFLNYSDGHLHFHYNYKGKHFARDIKDVTEARLPDDAHVCSCGQAWVMPKEERDGRL